MCVVYVLWSFKPSSWHNFIPVSIENGSGVQHFSTLKLPKTIWSDIIPQNGAGERCFSSTYPPTLEFVSWLLLKVWIPGFCDPIAGDLFNFFQCQSQNWHRWWRWESWVRDWGQQWGNLGKYHRILCFHKSSEQDILYTVLFTHQGSQVHPQYANKQTENQN